MHHNEADLVCHANTAVAITQIQEAIGIQPVNEWSNRAERIQKLHRRWKACLHAAESFSIAPSEPGSGHPVPYTTPQIVSALREVISVKRIDHASTLVLNKSISNYPMVWSHSNLKFLAKSFVLVVRPSVGRLAQVSDLS